jgi:hypothetical protein
LLIVNSFLFVHSALGAKPFVPAPNGAIAMKIGEFPNIDNFFFAESSCCKFQAINELCRTPSFLARFYAVTVEVEAFITA